MFNPNFVNINYPRARRVCKQSRTEKFRRHLTSTEQLFFFHLILSCNLRETRKTEPYIQVFAVGVSHLGVCTWQSFVDRYFQIVKSRGTRAFVLPHHQAINSWTVKWVAAHWFKPFVVFVHAIMSLSKRILVFPSDERSDFIISSRAKRE